MLPIKSDYESEVVKFHRFLEGRMSSLENNISTVCIDSFKNAMRTTKAEGGSIGLQKLYTFKPHEISTCMSKPVVNADNWLAQVRWTKRNYNFNVVREGNCHYYMKNLTSRRILHENLTGTKRKNFALFHPFWFFTVYWTSLLNILSLDYYGYGGSRLYQKASMFIVDKAVNQLYAQNLSHLRSRSSPNYQY